MVWVFFFFQISFLYFLNVPLSVSLLSSVKLLMILFLKMGPKHVFWGHSLIQFRRQSLASSWVHPNKNQACLCYAHVVKLLQRAPERVFDAKQQGSLLSGSNLSTIQHSDERNGGNSAHTQGRENF